MDINAFPQELKELVRKQLDTGRYSSVEDLLCEAVRIHGEQEAYFEANASRIKARIARGIEQAERGDLLDGEEAMDDLQRAMLTRRS